MATFAKSRGSIEPVQFVVAKFMKNDTFVPNDFMETGQALYYALHRSLIEGVGAVMFWGTCEVENLSSDRQKMLSEQIRRVMSMNSVQAVDIRDIESLYLQVRPP